MRGSVLYTHMHVHMGSPPPHTGGKAVRPHPQRSSGPPTPTTPHRPGSGPQLSGLRDKSFSPPLRQGPGRVRAPQESRRPLCLPCPSACPARARP